MAESNFMISGSHTSSSTSSNQPKLPPALDERLTYLEEQVGSVLDGSHITYTHPPFDGQDGLEALGSNQPSSRLDY